MAFSADMVGASEAALPQLPEDRRAVFRRSAIIALIAFLTLIDLFGSQALLPTLVKTYGVSPAAMGFAVNASTIGMAVSSLLIALIARRIDAATGIWVCLALLSIPTTLLAFTSDLTVFMLLRIAQGVFMAAAFALTLTYLSSICTVMALSGAMAAYITGNVASNLFGRLLASGLADNFGLTESFLGFAALNLLGAVVTFFY
ncbi:MAG: MFS transporter, partial [Pseudomonadota bacterium]